MGIQCSKCHEFSKHRSHKANLYVMSGTESTGRTSSSSGRVRVHVRIHGLNQKLVPPIMDYKCHIWRSAGSTRVGKLQVVQSPSVFTLLLTHLEQINEDLQASSFTGIKTLTEGSAASCLTCGPRSSATSKGTGADEGLTKVREILAESDWESGCQ
jgi:hypothetical protein